MASWEKHPNMLEEQSNFNTSPHLQDMVTTPSLPPLPSALTVTAPPRLPSSDDLRPPPRTSSASASSDRACGGGRKQTGMRWAPKMMQLLERFKKNKKTH